MEYLLLIIVQRAEKERIDEGDKGTGRTDQKGVRDETSRRNKLVGTDETGRADETGRTG